MASDISKILRKALGKLQAERKRIEQQIGAIESALMTLGGRRRRGGSRAASRKKRSRKAMSVAARKAVSRRMKAYWTKRKAEEGKAKEKAGK